MKYNNNNSWTKLRHLQTRVTNPSNAVPRVEPFLICQMPLSDCSKQFELVLLLCKLPVQLSTI